MTWAPRLTAGTQPNTNPVAKLDEAIRTRGLASASTRVAAILAIIVVFGLTVRSLLIMNGPAEDISRAMEPDSGRYIELADNLSAMQTFGKAAESSGVVHIPLHQMRMQRDEISPIGETNLYPEVFRTPGYPALLSVVRSLGWELKTILFLQALLSVGCVALIFGIGKQLYDSAIPGLIAAAGVAFHPADILYSASLLSETFFTFTMILGVFFAVLSRKNWVFGLVAGLFIGASVLIRPISILLPLAMALWVLASYRDRNAVLAAVCLIVSGAVAPGLWMARNNSVGQGFTISTVPTVNGYFYTANYIDIANKGGDFAADWAPTAREQFKTLEAEIKEGETTLDAMKRLGVDAIKSNPQTYAKLMARSSVKFMTDHSAGSMMARLGQEYEPTGLRERIMSGNFSMDGVENKTAFFVAAGWTGWNLLLAGLTFIGAAWMLYKKHFAALLLCGGTLVYFLLATQVTGLERFKVPVIGIQMLIIASLFAGTRSEKQTADQ